VAIRLICLTDLDRTPLLPQFLTHYAELGVDVMHIAVHVNIPAELEARRADLDHCAQVIAEHGGTHEGTICFPYDARIARAYLDHLVQDNRADRGDWILWADSDEFQRYPRDLRDCIAGWDTDNVDAVEGFFIDRITTDGQLAPLDPARPVWDQYPVCCNFTEKVLGAYVGKLVCARGAVRVDDGNHRLALNQCARLAADLVPVHHFKWNAEAIPRLKRRVTPEWQRTKFWWKESQRGLDHILTHGRINLAAVDLLTADGDLVTPAAQAGPTVTARWRPRADAH
jgi:hypothetical protein